MSATSIYFNGRMTRVPGSYSEVDASGLDTVGLAASGYLAIVGTAIGGKPYSAVDANDVAGTIQKSVKAGQARTFFRPGSMLLDAESLAFNPSNDDDIKAGAQRVYWVKVNPSAASSVYLENADGNALKLTSVDYGFHTTQIFAEVATGTAGGKKYSITFENMEEVFDNVGADAIFKLQYLATVPADGFTTVTCEVTASAVACAFTRTQAGLETDITNQVDVVGYASGEKIEIVSSAGGDVGIKVRVYGVDASGDGMIEDLTANGTSVVATAEEFNEVHGARIVSGVPAGTLTVRNLSGGTTILTLTSAATSKGLEACSDMPMASSAIQIVADAACARHLTVVGLSAAGAEQIEALQLNGTTAVAGAAKWSRVLYFGMGNVPVARTVTFSGNAINMPFVAYDTIKKMADWVGNLPGWSWSTITGQLAFDPSDLDVAAAVSCKSAAEPSFYATLYAAAAAINAGSQLVTAEAVSGGTSAPSNTVAPVFLAGGHEGSATPGSEAVPYAANSDWQAAFELLQKLFVNTIVPLSGDPTVHAYLKDHVAYMGGAGRMERDGIVGLMNAGLTTYPTKTETKAAIIDINSRNVRGVAQKFERYNAAGVKTVMQPYYAAVVAAGMQCGASVGTSLTHRYANTLGIYQDSSWHPVDDADEMLEMGLLFAEMVDGVGRRWVRNVTTHLTTSNLAYTEASVNWAANYTAYNFRTAMEVAVGKKGFAGTVQAAEGAARGILALLMDEALTAWRSLDIDLTLDVLEVSVEVAPVIPVNFVKNTIHLVAIPLT